jgi:hypothetical protein
MPRRLFQEDTMTAVAVTVLDDERLIREGEAAVDLYNKDVKNARTRIMPMARGLVAAKRKYPATQDFGDWLLTSPYREIEKDERAALIKIGANDTFAEKFMRTTILVSPRTIWDAIEELMPTSHDENSTASHEHSPEITPIEPPAPENTATPVPENVAAPIVSVTSPVVFSKKALTLSTFVRRGYPKAELVIGYMLDSNTRCILTSVLPAKRPGPLWALLVECIESGAYGAPVDAAVTQPNIRLLLPWLPWRAAERLRLDITKAEDLVLFRNDVLPIVLANRALLAEHPEQLPTLVSNHRAGRENAARKVREKEKVADAVAKMPTSERTVIAFGEHLWPRVNADHAFTFTYDELCHAAWFSQFLLNNLPPSLAPASKAMQSRHLIKYVTPMLKSRGWQVAVRQFLSAYEKNPGAE